MNIRLILKRAAQLLIVPMVAFAVGCNEQDPDTITVGNVLGDNGQPISVLDVSSESGKYTVFPSTDSWSVVSSEEWCVPQRDNCEKYDSNKSLELYIYSASHVDKGMEDGQLSRYATVTFTSGTATYSFLVAQGKSEDYIVLYPDAATVGYEAIDSTLPFTFSFFSSATTQNLNVNSSASWARVALNSTNNVVEVSVDENAGETSREATITLYITVSGSDYSNPVSQTFKLTQEGRNPSYVAASIAEYTFPAEDDATTASSNELEYDVTLSSNIYGATYTATSSQSWCKVVESATAGVFTITADENNSVEKRAAATITFTATSGDETIVSTTTVTVYQVGVDMPSISIGTKSYSYGAEASAATESILFSAVSDEITAATNVDWLKISATTNDGIEFTLDANDSSAARIATVTITATKGGVSVTETITITQEFEALVFDVTPMVVEVFAEGESIEFTAAASSSATVTWVNPSDADKVGVTHWCQGSNGSYTISANTTGLTRKCSIIVTATLGEQEIVKELTVIQYGTTYKE